MASQRDVKNRISSVKNIQKITRAMEMVAGARLRRAEQRIAALRPYADALRRMTRQAAQAAGAEASRLPLLSEHDSMDKVGLLLVTGDRGLAGGFNSQIIRAGVRISGEYDEDNVQSAWFAAGRRGVSSLTFRGYELGGSYTGFADKPAYSDARSIADDLITGYCGRRARPRGDRLQRLHLAAHPAGHARDAAAAVARDDRRGGAARTSARPARPSQDGPRALVAYEPDPEEILKRLVPDYVEISIYRALVESTAGFFGAQMTAMRSASDNAGEIITDLTLQMNRARQAEITQEIMEVVAGAEGVT